MAGKAIVVGASSGIGAALVGRLVRDGWAVCAVARRAEALEAVCASATGPGRAVALVHDVTAPDSVPGAYAEASRLLEGVDLVVYSAGVMPSVALDEFDDAKDRAIFEVNVWGGIAWCNAAARDFAPRGRGTIVGIGSVAGERGRLGNPAYCASKAALHTFLEALRNRLDRHGVQVITIKPGPVHTPMTAGRDDLPLAVQPDQVADAIVAAVASGRQTLFVPGIWAPIMAVIRAIPSVIFRRLNV